MFGQNRFVAVAATIATDVTFSTAINITGANRIAVEVPTFAAGTTTEQACVHAHVCDTIDGTFRPLFDQGLVGAASSFGVGVWETPGGAGNFVANCPAHGHNYLKICLASTAGAETVTASAGLSVRVYVMN